MSTDAKAVIEGAYAAWQARNLPALMPLLADDIVFALHVPADVLPIGGETRGKTAVAAVLQGLLDGYDFLAYDPSPLTVDGARVESDVRFQYRQNATGEVIASRLHHRWSTADGKVTRLEEWHDLPTVRAFFDRVALRVASNAQRG